MNLFFHDVGKKGADEDFPKTVFSSVNIKTIQKLIPPQIKATIISNLNNVFPEGKFNVWGVPAGASSVIENLHVNDTMLLIRTIAGEGEIPVLCTIKAFWKVEMREVSRILWGSDRFPYIFFFTTEKINLTWNTFKNYVQYNPRFRPSGNVYLVQKDRLGKFGGVAEFIDLIKREHQGQVGNVIIENNITPSIEYKEGERMVKERAFFKRNTRLVKKAKEHFGYVCQACGFDFEKTYGILGKEYIECHHVNPLSERLGAEISSTIEDVRVVCSNCHRMLHRNETPLTVEELREIIHKNKS